MAKKVSAVVKLQIVAGRATAAPPVGPALAPHGVNLGEFVKSFNEKTAQNAGEITPVEVTVFDDRSFTFILKTPPAAYLLKKAAGIERASGVPNRDKVAKVTLDQVKEIAKVKMADLNANDIDAAAEMVKGTARSMGIVVEG